MSQYLHGGLHTPSRNVIAYLPRWTVNIGGQFISGVRRYSIYLRWLFATVNKDPMYLSAPYPLPNQQKEASIASYEEHNRKVRELIPQDRLLEYSVKEGWEPLCKFLELESCPTTPFPKTNSARSVRVQAISSFIVPFSVVFFIICLVFVKVFRQLTGTTPIDWFNWKVGALMLSLSGKKVPARPKQAWTFRAIIISAVYWVEFFLC